MKILIETTSQTLSFELKNTTMEDIHECLHRDKFIRINDSSLISVSSIEHIYKVSEESEEECKNPGCPCNEEKSIAQEIREQLDEEMEKFIKGFSYRAKDKK